MADSSLLLKRLQTFEFLRGLNDAALIELARSAIWKVFQPDAVVFWEGDVESKLFYLHYGSLKVIKTSPEGREQVLRFIEAGEGFNENGVLAKPCYGNGARRNGSLVDSPPCVGNDCNGAPVRGNADHRKYGRQDHQSGHTRSGFVIEDG